MPPTTVSEKPVVPLPTIIRVFFWIGFFSFGGGLTAWIHSQVVQRYHWMEEEDFMSGVALAQVLPGANVTNLCVYVGYRLRGYLGATATLVSLISGPTVLCVLVAMAYHRVSEYPVLQACVDGVAAAAVGLNLRLGIIGGKRVIRRIAPTVAMIATFLAVGVFEWPLVPVVLVVAPLSVAAVWPRKEADA
ncbi:MAG: chromate transporter [Beijerinckiaceae bacterium]|jgi:chromate transporter|nr:chromate transporter [Beijerinckiaceae bacterium]MBX9759665.1 chromate transporter [Beijerinckiaceae bacterium]MDO9441521.1 chromate transporter [Beijerinckiaceae bacterium]